MPIDEELDDKSTATDSTELLTDYACSVDFYAMQEEDDGLTMNGLEVTYTDTPSTARESNVISQEDAPSQRTRSKAQALLSAVEISGSCPSASQAATRRYPLPFLADFAGAVIDN